MNSGAAPSRGSFMGRKIEDTLEYKHVVKIFPVRLKEMMGDMTFSQLALLSGVSPGTLTNWSKGRTTPGLPSLISVCNVLDASIDWIVGLDEIANSNLQDNIDLSQDIVSDTQHNVYYIQHLEDDET